MPLLLFLNKVNAESSIFDIKFKNLSVKLLLAAYKLMAFFHQG